jgi:ABC-type sugar transport system ATPase subunit
MTETIRQLTRRPDAVTMPAPKQVTPDDPAVVGFLNRFSSLEKECNELRIAADRDAVTIATQAHRIEFQDGVIKSVTHQRDSFQRGYLEMRAQVSILGNAAINCLEKSNQALARDGINPDLPKSDALDDGAARIGRQFAPRQTED